MRKFPHKQSSIASQFILYVVLFSSLITLITTVVQLYRDYNTDLTLIRVELKQIETVHLESLTAALWASNRTLIQTSIEGILNLRDMQYVEIRDEQQVWAKAGEIKGNNNIQQSYAMIYRHRNSDINIGKLTISVSLDGVHQRLLDKVWVILISNGIKTFFVALFIYFLFYRLVARHLSAISNFAEGHDPLSDEAVLRLDRDSKKYDEFDAVVESINDMHTRLHGQISEINNQKQTLSLTLNSIGDAVITTDEKGCVTLLNPVAVQLTGWEVDEAMGQQLKTIFPIINASTREPIANPIEKVMKTGEIIYLSNHTTLISKTGEEIQIADSAAPILSEGKILGMVLVFNDVTEQYKMREKLGLKEQEQREILQSIVDAVITIDETGIIHSFNSSAERLFDYPEQEVIGKKINQLMPESFSNAHDGFLQNYLKTGEAKVIGTGREVVGLRKNKKTFPMRLFVAELPPTSDGVRRFIGSCIDLTHIKEQEDHLRRSQKMDALGKLTGGIAHDYNNILGIVLGFAEQISENLNDTKKVAAYSKSIKYAAERGSKLTNKLLSFSKHKKLDLTVMSINNLLQEQQDMFRKILTARIDFSLALAKDLWLVEIDSSDLEDAIINICINAFHAMEFGGKLTINTSNEQLNTVDVRELDIDEGDYILLKIIDTGVGMDATTRDKIFDPFFTTKGEQGSGLGLSQVYGFVKRSGGAVKVYSELGRGCCFALYFPRSDKLAAKKENTGIASTKDLRGTETILIVDDEQTLVDLAREIFVSHGYQVLTANDGIQALAVLEKEKVDLVVTDVIMPNMDGFQLAAKINKYYPSIKIQMVSGFLGENHTSEIDPELHKNLLNKPYTSNHILSRVRRLLDESDSCRTISNCRVMTLDDDDDIQTLYKINFKKLGCQVVTVFTGEEAVEHYKKVFETDDQIDLLIVDLSIPGGMGGVEVTSRIRKIDPNLKVIVASGNVEGPEMLRPQEFGFDAALDKVFDIKEMKQILQQVLK